jgi:hypothetical protein
MSKPHDASTGVPELRDSEVQNILKEVCEIMGVRLGPGLARYIPLIAKARELAALAVREPVKPATAAEP